MLCLYESKFFLVVGGIRVFHHSSSLQCSILTALFVTSFIELDENLVLRILDCNELLVECIFTKFLRKKLRKSKLH